MLHGIIGHHFGAQRWRAIGDDLQQALWLSFLAIAGLPIVLATDDWLGFARVNADVASIATTRTCTQSPSACAAYARVRSVAFRKDHDDDQRICAALKVPLNAIFMSGAGPIPPMGGAGAGVAAVLAWITRAASVRRQRQSLFPALSQRRHSPSALGESVRSAEARRSDRLVRSFRGDVVHVHGGVARLGVGGHQVVANVAAILFMVPLALGIATSVLVSLGAGAPRVARVAALRGFRLSIGIALMAAVLVWLLREPLVALYTIDAGSARSRCH